MPAPPFPDTDPGQAPAKFQLRNFAGINRNVARSAIGDQQHFWLENMMPVANGNLRAMFAEAGAVFTGVNPIINVYTYVLLGTPYAILFIGDGSATQVRLTDGNTTAVAGANTFSSVASGVIPVAAQFNAQGIVITSQFTANSYWAWDGATLTATGQAAPTWLTNGAVLNMPAGIHGNAIEIYQNRVWIAAPSQTAAPALTQSELITSAPGNGADFLTADGAVITPQQDASLKLLFTALKQANGYLYAFGDSNVSIIYNVVSSGTPVITTFTNQNLDPQTGCAWNNTAQLMGQILVFANKQGVYAINGGIPIKISYELDRIFANADFTVIPSAAVAIIFGIKCYMLLIKAPDQSNVMRNYLCVWDTKEWFIASQLNASMSQVYTQELNSVMTAYGSDGVSLFQLFQTPNNALQKIQITKLWAGGQSDDQYMIYKKVYRLYQQALDYSGTGVAVIGMLDADATSTPFSAVLPAAAIVWLNASAQIIQFRNATPANVNFIVTGAVSIFGTDMVCYGRLVGVTQNFVGSDFAFVDLQIMYAGDQTFVG